jgi:hypothetical protein
MWFTRGNRRNQQETRLLLLLGCRLYKSGNAIAVHTKEVGGGSAPDCPSTVNDRICSPHQSNQAFQVMEVPFYPMDTNTCKMVSL